MRTTKIQIKNLFGLSEMELDGRDVELTGANGTGKSSVLDAIRYALTNGSERDCIIRRGEKEGQIVIEAGSSMRIARAKRTEKADYKSVKQDGREISGAESFLKTIFSPMQLDPVAFVQMDKKAQNRMLLDMIDFSWDLNWIREQFGEIPEGVDYSQNILQVLSDIQSENGAYFKERQSVNRDIRNKQAFIEDIARTIPENYDAARWEAFDLGEIYQKIERINSANSRIERAKVFLKGEDGKIRGIEADYLAKVAAQERETAAERQNITADIARMEEAIRAGKEKLAGLDGALEEKKQLFAAEKEAQLAKLGNDCETARQYANREMQDVSPLQKEAETASAMKGHLREYARMQEMQRELDDMRKKSERLTEKIEKARSLPGEILRTASIPVEGMTVENGTVMIHGLPVSNLSEGEKLSLCVDVALARPNALSLILLDGVEKLSDENRDALYARCREKGVQFIATRTTNDSELEVHYL